ncbi:MAG: alpha-L-fucosidase [Candidatus Omnitrophica bacterium]|nr:alpha-L-fucosidase [Candidatus Omnitrophota bacterium]
MKKSERIDWFKEARFGMFIHWGLYSIPAGEWKGKKGGHYGEWIMSDAKIPRAEYEQLAQRFNPLRFDADGWVNLAKDTGMKYIVAMPKHHDGFSMYDSKISNYNIVATTPFKRDPMKELAQACQKKGLRLCFYYSQAQDWHHPNAAGNDWDYPDESKKDFARYFKEKVRSQVKELLTRYGRIGLMWFDTPAKISKKQSEELTALVHKLQPNCLVNSRVGRHHGAGDYREMGDNEIPEGPIEEPWETAITMNDTYAYKKSDTNWKSSSVLIHKLVDTVSKGGNFLLNVGPKPDGTIPIPSVKRLKEIGTWMKENKESIYGCGKASFGGGMVGLTTAKNDKVYLHTFRWPGEEICLAGVKNKIKSAYLLASNEKISITQKAERLFIQDLPKKAPDPINTVIVLKLG